MRIVILVLAAVIVLVTALPLSRSPKWWIRGLDFPKLQIAVSGLLLLAAELAFLNLSGWVDLLALAATVGCLVYQAWWIMPYTRLHRTEVRQAACASPGNTLRILASNVLSTNHNSDGLIALIREHDPDIFVTLESDAWWQERLDTLQEDYPHSIKCPLENFYGMHVYSRLPLEDAAIQFLVEPDVPSMHAMVLVSPQLKVRMHFLHPAPPSPTENDESSERDAELLVVGKSVAGLDVPVVVAGDLNDVGWSPTTRLFRKISGLLDPRIGRGMFNTFHADYWFVRWPLDHLFHSRHFTLSYMKRLPSFGSDHFPVLVELVHDPANMPKQEGLKADAEDHAIAEEKIAQEDVQVEDVHEPKA